MNRNETAALLAQNATFTKQAAGEADVIAWHAALGGIPFYEASEALVEFHRTSTDMVKPAHLLALVKDRRNDEVERRSKDPAYRQARDEARDERLAELLGGDRRVLDSPGTGNGCVVGGPEPIRGATQAEVMDEVRTRWGLNRNVRTIEALVIDWTRPDVLDQVCAVTKLSRTEAAVALHTIDCKRKGLAMPEPKPRISERRTRREQSRRAKKENAKRARSAAASHIRSVGEIPIFEQHDGVA